jgi:hypothetical protein
MIKNKSGVYKFISLLMLLSIACAMFTFYYQATFTRYHADDYCSSAKFASPGVGGWLVDRYLEKSPRYSNILYVGLVNFFGLTGIRFAPSLALTIWIMILAWLSRELRHIISLDELPVIFDYVIAGLFVSISVYSAPDRFQTLFWRSGSSTHFIPIVFLSFLLAFLLWRDRNSGTTPLTRRTFLFVFLFSFITVGFSEPPATVMVASGIISISVLMYYGGVGKYRLMLLLFIYALAGAVIGFLVMFFSPGKAFRLSTTPTVDVFILRTLRFPLEFLLDAIRVAPVPTFFLFSVSVVFFFCTFQIYTPPILRFDSLILKILIVLLAMYVLIAASFAPSVYGQSYPVARARFLGYLFFNAALLLSGGFIGIWLANVIRFSWGVFVGMALLALSIVYPLRIASTVLAEIPANRSWALAWDRRDAEIRSLKSQGVMNLTVIKLPEVSNVGELGDTPTFINNCAARFYGVNSILAYP